MEIGKNFQEKPTLNTSTKIKTPEVCLTDIRKSLLNKRDLLTENFLQQLMDDVESSLPEHMTDAEKSEEMSKYVMSKLHEIGSILAVKFNGLVKTMVDYRKSQNFVQELATISVPEISVKEKTEVYKRMFFRFLDSDSVSYRVLNACYLGGLTHEELFILTYFVFATCQRSRGDGILQLYISGITSTGKTKLLETPLMPSAHQMVSSTNGDAGCGRFTTKSKSIVILHDVNIGVLFSADMSMYKAMARSEECTAKVHSSTESVAPVFLFVTSNDRMFDHKIPPQKQGQLPTKLPSQVFQSGNKRPRMEHVDAMLSRFLEVHVRKACHQDAEDLRRSDCFRKIHLVLALYDRVLDIVASKTPDHFHSKYMYHYLLSSLEKNCELYCKYTDVDQDRLSKTILQLKIQYFGSEGCDK